MQKWLQGIFQKLASKRVQTSMEVIYWYGAGLVLLTTLMVISWLANWYHTGIPDTKSIVDIFDEYTKAAVVAAFTFVSVFSIDKNGDRRPDAAESLVDKKQSSQIPAIPIRMEKDTK